MINERGAGILLHISSLPSVFGIGDLGPEAKNFADFLVRSHQKYWQLLPLNPTEKAQQHSPYSSISSQAGNILFISPHLLVEEGLLHFSEVEASALPEEAITDYEQAKKIKDKLLGLAWKNYSEGAANHLKNDFDTFKILASRWLNDFALYEVLKKINGDQAWFDWNEEHKHRGANALLQVQEFHAGELEKIKFFQFLFSRQWEQLKKYCNQQGIRLIGDLPFYVSYDSADVWSFPQFFSVDRQGKMTGVAGVPPDAFSDGGQLWGMPVFKWEILRKENYAWWLERLRRNMELFDFIRLDHFRAFSAYWEVPAGSLNAKNGKWQPGPGIDFFTAVKHEFGQLPFIAEDLGDIDNPVIHLREQFHLPGMKVLQFAFGAGFSRSEHIPHHHEKNFIVYTGTHDNNTTRGWFDNDADELTRRSMEQYTGHEVPASDASSVLSRMAYASVASTVILPMQDVLNLDGTARMNLPATMNNNWIWKLITGQLNEEHEMMLRHLAVTYNR